MVSKVKAATKSEQLGVFAQTLVAKLLFPMAPEHVEAMLRQMKDTSPEETLAIMGAMSVCASITLSPTATPHPHSCPVDHSRQPPQGGSIRLDPGVGGRCP